MHAELRVEARHDLLEGAWFYEQQRAGLATTSCEWRSNIAGQQGHRPIIAFVGSRRMVPCIPST